jgi:phosphodiesterase/alkaline phosphatase D-like protein
MKLKTTAALLAMLSLATVRLPAQSRETWPDPAANHMVPYQTSGLTHGPVLGRPAADSARVWIRTAEAGPFRVVYGDALPISEESPGVAGQTTAERDNTGFVDLAGLKPNTRYYYGIVLADRLADTRMDFDQPWPSFRTLPDASSYVDEANNPRGLFNLRFSVGCGGCQDPVTSGGQYGSAASFHNLRKLHADELMFHVNNGDYIYEELRDGTLEGYRNNYKLYLSRGRSMADLFRYLPNLVVFDDHEMDRETGGFTEVGLKRGPWLGRDLPLKAWGEYVGWADYDSPWHAPLRFGTAQVEKGSDLLVDAEADFSTLDFARVSSIHLHPKSKNAGVYAPVEVLDKHRLRIRPALEATETCGYSIGTHYFFDWKLGNCHFFALDCRSERTRYTLAKQRDPNQVMLGAVQRQWLIDGVKNTDAQFIFIVSSVPWVIPHTAYHVRQSLDPKGDSFVMFLPERELLLETFDALSQPVILLTGDVHNSFAIQVTDNVWEFLCGPMNSAAHPIGTAGKPDFGGWYDSAGRRVKIKWVAGFPDNVHYTRLHNTYYGIVQVNNVFKSGRPEGPGYQWVAYDSPQVVVRFHDGYTGTLLYAEGISLVDLEK